MLALFSLFRRSYPGWRRLTTLEGVNVLFQQNVTRSSSLTDNMFGQFNGTTYSARAGDSNFSTLLTVRDYSPGETVEPEERFAAWKAEFLHAMKAYEITVHLVKEHISHGKQSRCDLLFTNPDETVFTRISLIAKGTRLIILFAVGMLQEVSGPACTECFRSLRY